MTDLLSPQDTAEFFAAIKDVTDTFYKTPIVYLQINKDFDLWERERPDTVTEVNLLCRPNKQDDTEDEMVERSEGAINEGQTEFQFNFDDLKVAGLTSGEQVTFKEGVEFFKWENEVYKIMLISYADSNFAGTPAIVYVLAEKSDVGEN